VRDRNPKAETQDGCETASMPTAVGFRISGFLQVLGFGFWSSVPALLLLATQPLFAATTNAPGPDAIPPLRPPHAQIPPTFWEQCGLWVVMCGCLLLALIGAAAWFLTQPGRAKIVPPEVQARRELEPLRQQPEEGMLLSRVSQVLRHYVTAAFNLPPGELTTTEFCRAIATHAPIGPELSATLSEFLRQCDQRKFSPPAPAPPLSAVAQAFELIDQGQARLAALAQCTPHRAGGSGTLRK